MLFTKTEIVGVKCDICGCIADCEEYFKHIKTGTVYFVGENNYRGTIHLCYDCVERVVKNEIIDGAISHEEAKKRVAMGEEYAQISANPPVFLRGLSRRDPEQGTEKPV